MRSESADAALAAIRENIVLAESFMAGLDRDDSLKIARASMPSSDAWKSYPRPRVAWART